ncbi:DNA damage-inducible transcript 4-like protein [Paramormyrops kingsleyae]|uniref:DNA damage-inducible transcript 4-like protein n=1 Tax=Paramormyrops kingsleyae TaxID=1676925 RepID=A0A3B3QB47_9TELE|nr:DNA damage-inducible transcript 4-like protein [Paramormyrops kingsleyae]
MVYTQALVFGNSIPMMSEEDNVAHFMRRFVEQFTSSAKKDTDGRSLKERYENSKNSGMDWLSREPDVEQSEESRQVELTRRIELCLSDAKLSCLHCHQLQLPRQLTAHVARDILRCSADEPCGLRGALIQLYLETKGALQHVGSLTPDRSVTPTFELSVVFKADVEGWPALKQLFATDKALRLCPGYRLVKRKLYSSASPVIRDLI